MYPISTWIGSLHNLVKPCPPLHCVKIVKFYFGIHNDKFKIRMQANILIQKFFDLVHIVIIEVCKIQWIPSSRSLNRLEPLMRKVLYLTHFRQKWFFPKICYLCCESMFSLSKVCTACGTNTVVKHFYC